ncbi:molybdopterin-dependent oxidoreductase [Tunturibacter empetritectus]|uniref:molybdopterin-dependent oxidoreductase n=1 Tax=Tunturiibacter empetritectus TaxID=3069691 RepID=UPI0033409F15
MSCASPGTNWSRNSNASKVGARSSIGRGVQMVDFLDAYPPALIDGQEPRYVYMETSGGDYYTGYDMQVCRHPQTLLVTELMGAPLTQFHGAPLRLHMPTKYGYKQIKRIGLISYTNMNRMTTGPN